MVAHPRPAAPKIPPCTPNEFFAKQLPITSPPEDILGHIAWQLPLIWAPAASHTPSRSPSKAHRLAAIWRKPAKKRTTQIAQRRARRGGSIIRGQQSFPRHPLRPFRLSDFSSRKSPGPAGALMSACYPPSRPLHPTKPWLCGGPARSRLRGLSRLPCRASARPVGRKTPKRED